MIRVLYRWTVDAGAEADFVAWWSMGTAQIRSRFPGAMGSALLRPRTGDTWAAVARWESYEEWAAFRESAAADDGTGAPWRLLSSEPFDEVEDQTV